MEIITEMQVDKNTVLGYSNFKFKFKFNNSFYQ